MHILHVVGARPNFMKLAPVMRALEANSIRQTVVHTGQHYDINMSGVFFRDLEIPEPDVNLQVGSGTHAQQTAEIMRRVEPVLAERRPDIVIVYGDVNSTVATALVCSKMLIPVAHVEAGLRSFDRSMPEEVNRLLTDQLSDILFTPSHDGNENLEREGIPAKKIRLVGNVMIDTLRTLLPKARERGAMEVPDRFALVTIHRPANVDDCNFMKELFRSLQELSHAMTVIFPLHPRTRQQLENLDSVTSHNGLRLLDPLPYLDFLAFEMRATVVITDSGGIQEETTFLDIPCFTLRDNTERPVTTVMGTNKLLGRRPEALLQEVRELPRKTHGRTQVPPLWDGHAAERIARELR